MRRAFAIALGALFVGIVVTHAVFAQHPGMPMPHGPMPGVPMQHHQPMVAPGEPSQPGQAAFGTIAEIVRLLDADPQTDWNKVNLERLRQHLIDMNEVVLRARVKHAPLPDGLAMEVTGAGRTEQAIRAMVVPHASELDRMPAYAAKAEPIPGGVRLTVTAKNADDKGAVARLRGLGFAGLLTEGGHHGPHHLAMAKGEAVGSHAH
jgi:hypothetical protein